jgi:hypothetical protein
VRYTCKRFHFNKTLPHFSNGGRFGIPQAFSCKCGMAGKQVVAKKRFHVVPTVEGLAETN